MDRYMWKGGGGGGEMDETRLRRASFELTTHETENGIEKAEGEEDI